MAAYPHLVGGEQDRPASVHAEMTILGAMLVEPVAIIDATMLLKTDDFALDSHRKIYTAMLHLAELGHAVDIVTVAEELSTEEGAGLGWRGAVSGVAERGAAAEAQH